MACGKNIVLCSDGTGNTMMKGRGTNVWKIYEAVDLSGHRWLQSNKKSTDLGQEQVAFYDDGVGSQDNRMLKIVGGAFGLGLKRNVRDLYKSLCRAYRPGDRIYIFGFSRGAYTARTLAGLILSCGILKREYTWTDKCLDDMSRKAYFAFRSHFRLGMVSGSRAIKKLKKAVDCQVQTSPSHAVNSSDASQLTEYTVRKAEDAMRRASSKREKATVITDEFRRHHSISHDEHAPDGIVTIQFVGVWDTVAAIGLPFKWLTDFWNRFIYPFMFPDYELSPNVLKGCHALAIDDERLTFHPMMWDERHEDSNSGHVEQVWFSGAHSNVGGGYPKQGMSLVALDWMMQRAEEQGLIFIDSERERYRHLQNVHDVLYDSRSGLAMYYRYAPRDIGKICNKFGVLPKIHVSAFERIATGTQDYAPGSLPREFTITTTDLKSNAPIEKPATLSQIAATIGSGTASQGVEHWIIVRKYIYLGLIALTATVLALAARSHSNAEQVELWVPSSWDALLRWIANLVPFGGDVYEFLFRPFLVDRGYALVLIILFGVFYGARRYIKFRLHSTHAGFWRQKLPGPWW